MPRASNTGQRRAQIVQAMSSVMARSGYDGATVNAVAEEAGLTPGLVHYHFKSKLEILLSLITNLENAVNERFENRLKAKGGDSPKTQLKAFIEAYLGLGKDSNPDAVACWIAIGTEALRDEQIKNAYQDVSSRQLSKLEKIIRARLKNSPQETRATRQLALGIYAAIEGCYRLQICAPKMVQPGFAAPTVLRMAEGLLAAPNNS
jgi:TetR/AcrR family transcriptional repressor of bet genes